MGINFMCLPELWHAQQAKAENKGRLDNVYTFLDLDAGDSTRILAAERFTGASSSCLSHSSACYVLSYMPSSKPTMCWQRSGFVLNPVFDICFKIDPRRGQIWGGGGQPGSGP